MTTITTTADARLRAVHGPRMACRRLFFAGDALGRRVWRRRPAARAGNADRAATSTATGLITLSDYDERSSAGSVYGQARIGSGLAAHGYARRPHRSLVADERRPRRPGSTPSCVLASTRACAAAAASIVSFRPWTKSMGFRAAVARCARSARCTSTRASSIHFLARRDCSSTSTHAVSTTCCGRQAPSLGLRQTA